MSTIIDDWKRIASLSQEVERLTRERDANHNLAVANGSRAEEEEARAEAAEAEVVRLTAERGAAHAFISDLVHMQSSARWTRAAIRTAAKEFLDAAGKKPVAPKDTTPAFVLLAEVVAERDAALERVKALEAEATADIGPEIVELSTQLELSGISGELIDAVASAIRADGSDVCDGAWASLSETSKIGWRGDAIRAIAALVYLRSGIKDYLTLDFACPALSHKEA